MIPRSLSKKCIKFAMIRLIVTANLAATNPYYTNKNNIRFTTFLLLIIRSHGYNIVTINILVVTVSRKT